MNGNTRRKLRKEYIPLIIALLVLVVLVLALIIVIFYKDNKGLVVPDLPDKEAINVGVYDFESGKYSGDKLDTTDTKKTKVSYEAITDYYTNGIFISDPIVNYNNEEFILRSGTYALNPYVSVIDMKGKLKWVSKLAFAEYESLTIVDVIKHEDKYHVFAVGNIANTNKKDNLIIKLNNNGAEEAREVISKDSDNYLRSVEITDKGFVLMSDGQNNLEIYYIDFDYKMIKNPFYLKDSKDNIFKTYIPYISASVINNEVVTMIIRYVGVSNDTMYLINYDLNKNHITINKFGALNNLASPYTDKIHTYKNNFYMVYHDVAYLFSTGGSLIKKYDYSSIKLDDMKDCEVEEGDEDTCADELWIGEYSTHDNGIFMVQGNTTSDNKVIDVFDKDLKIIKRFMHGEQVHDGEEMAFISSVYVDDKLYEFYSFGVETTSILVSIIG